MIFIIIGIVLLAVFLFIGSLLLVNRIVSNNVYGHRGDSSISIKYLLPSDYPNLNVKKSYFLNNKKARLSIYEYQKKDTKPKAMVLISHGIGGGHFYLLPLIEYLCNRGLLVLAYDQYASGTSEGRMICSMNQGAIDIKYAIKYVEAHYNLPFNVLGHSWGGYCVAQGLRYSKKIEKCVSIAGLNNEASMASAAAKPFVLLGGFLKYGKYAFYSSYGAFKKSSAKILYLQGKNDGTVSPKKTGEKYQKKFKNRENISVILLDKKGHSPIVSYESQLGQTAVMKQFGMLCKELVPLKTFVDFNKNNVPDMDVYNLIGDFLID